MNMQLAVADQPTCSTRDESGPKTDFASYVDVYSEHIRSMEKNRAVHASRAIASICQSTNVHKLKSYSQPKVSCIREIHISISSSDSGWNPSNATNSEEIQCCSNSSKACRLLDV